MAVVKIPSAAELTAIEKPLHSSKIKMSYTKDKANIRRSVCKTTLCKNASILSLYRHL